MKWMAESGERIADRQNRSLSALAIRSPLSPIRYPLPRQIPYAMRNSFNGWVGSLAEDNPDSI